jgi:hypothetical protein
MWCTAGTYIWNVPDHVSNIDVKYIQGAGGGGGAGSVDEDIDWPEVFDGGGGGGNGKLKQKDGFRVEPGGIVTIIIGAGGRGGLGMTNVPGPCNGGGMGEPSSIDSGRDNLSVTGGEGGGGAGSNLNGTSFDGQKGEPSIDAGSPDDNTIAKGGGGGGQKGGNGGKSYGQSQAGDTVFDATSGESSNNFIGGLPGDTLNDPVSHDAITGGGGGGASWLADGGRGGHGTIRDGLGTSFVGTGITSQTVHKWSGYGPFLDSGDAYHFNIEPDIGSVNITSQRELRLIDTGIISEPQPTGGVTLNGDDIQNPEGFIIPGQRQVGIDFEPGQITQAPLEVIGSQYTNGGERVTTPFSYSTWFFPKSTVSDRDKLLLIQIGGGLNNHFSAAIGTEGYTPNGEFWQDLDNDADDRLSFVFSMAGDGGTGQGGGDTIYRRYRQTDFQAADLGTMYTAWRGDEDYWYHFSIVYDPGPADEVRIYFDNKLLDRIPLNGVRFNAGRSPGNPYSQARGGHVTFGNPWTQDWICALRIPGQNADAWDSPSLLSTYNHEWTQGEAPADMYMNNLRIFHEAISFDDISSMRQADTSIVSWEGDTGLGGTLTLDAVGQDGTKGSGGGGGGAIIMVDGLASLAIAPTNPGGKGGDGCCEIEWLDFQP